MLQYYIIFFASFIQILFFIFESRCSVFCLIHSLARLSLQFSNQDIEGFLISSSFQRVFTSVFLFIEFSFQIVNYLHHFIHPCICIFLDTTQVFLIPLVECNEVFDYAFKFLDFFDKVYASAFKLCPGVHLGSSQ